jgi:hypothetical protein
VTETKNDDVKRKVVGVGTEADDAKRASPVTEQRTYDANMKPPKAVHDRGDAGELLVVTRYHKERSHHHVLLSTS